MGITRSGLPRAEAMRPTVCLVGGPDIDARLDLMRHLADDFDLCAVGTDVGVAPSFDREGFRFRSYRMARGVEPANDVRALASLMRVFLSERPTIVHTFDTKPGVWGRLAAKLVRIPIVIGTLPGLGSLYAHPTRAARLIRMAYEPMQTLSSRLSDLTIFQNPVDEAEFVRRGVVPHRRTAVISGSGVRTDLFRPTNSVGFARSARGLRASSFVVTMVSRVTRSKGALEFAAAARLVRSAHPNVEFVLVGAGDADSLDALTAPELEEIRASVNWLGHRTDVRELLALSDVFVFPSYYREGVPRALLEAAATGLPLVAAQGAGSAEVVVDGLTGLLVEPKDPTAIADAIARLIESSELRTRLGANARELAVSRFDVSRVAERTRACYAELLAAKEPWQPVLAPVA